MRQSVEAFAARISGCTLSPGHDECNRAGQRTAGSVAGTVDRFDNAANPAGIVKFAESIDTSTQSFPIP